VYSIRQADKSDIPLIRELTYQVWPQTYASILSQEQIDYMLELMYSPRSLEQQMDEGCDFRIIYAGGVPVGFASVQETEPHIFKLHKIYILLPQQGKGTGKFLLEHIIDEIKKKGAKVLQLQVNRFNKAKEFYEKLGFAVVYEADFEIGNGFFMNDYVMEKKL
jgi:N-acetylglutamate synthase-like GNAT family acetyltransferase